MTDPVDTDTLAEAWRAKCEHYAAIGINPSSHMSFFDGYMAAHAAATDELDRLRAMIADTPHQLDCSTQTRAGNCGCWKADPL